MSAVTLGSGNTLVRQAVCERCGDEFPVSIMQDYALPVEQSKHRAGPKMIKACMVCVSELAAESLGQKEPFEFPGDPIKIRNLEMTRNLKANFAKSKKGSRSTADTEELVQKEEELVEAKLAEQEAEAKRDLELKEQRDEALDAADRTPEEEVAELTAEADDESDKGKKADKNKAPEDEDTEDMVDRSTSTRGSGNRRATRNS